MFDKILIANRGEIACRILRTTKKLGIRSVAVYSSIDADCLHVRLADEAYCIGEAKVQSSYLNQAAILHVAQQSGCQAIHPGYGFLSENPQFAAACEAAGILFIGPSEASMLAMASKQIAKQHLEKTKVPLTPGYHGQDQSDATLLSEAERIGFPVLLKPANGGGGKGMHAVYEKTNFLAELASARREALASFGDAIMIIEKLIHNPHHIEVQIMADNHGNVIHLYERDCSVQRRHQKIIEEAPAIHLKPAIRQKLTQAACEVAKTIAYRGAGTVEFLMDSQGNFYFMEMNTRLQVEHPVTEMITGLDLVEWQLRIAANQALPLTQDQITCQGHAIECRIYAEDPDHDFMPSTGTIELFQPPQGQDVRLDSGVDVGQTISMYYDPMIAKLIVHGDNREEAVRKLEQALAQFYLAGMKNNLSFLRTIIHTPAFRQAEITTDFLNQHPIAIDYPSDETALLFAAAYDYLCIQKDCQKKPLWADSFAWGMLQPNYWFTRYRLRDTVYTLRIQPQGDHRVMISWNDTQHLIEAQYNNGILFIKNQDLQRHCFLYANEKFLHCFCGEGNIQVQRISVETGPSVTTNQESNLASPMPATVVAVLKNKGDSVKQGERIIILEAMKMEHTVHAPKDGVIADIFYEVGCQVAEGVPLAALDETL